MRPTRRQILKWGLGATAFAGLGVAGKFVLLPPTPSPVLAPVPELAARLFEVLDEEERAGAVFPYEHPLRQFHNRGVDTDGAWTFFLAREARQLVVDLVYASLSESGRLRVSDQFFLSLPGVHATRLAIFGDPRRGPYQILVTGPHLNLRIGGRNREGVAFGGPQVYGDQQGNEKVGLPGNAYRDQLETGQRLIADLTSAERLAVRLPRAPVQTGIELQGNQAAFDGIPVADLSRSRRADVTRLVSKLLGTFADSDVAYAWQCLEHNGGIDQLHLADYAEDHQPGRNVGDGPSQIFRLEGPAAVFHFRGEPHLHAFINVAMDGENPLSVGEVVAENPVALERRDVKRLFEAILLRETGAELAYYHAESVAGRLRAGTIRTGDLYNLESWRENVSVIEIEGAELNPTLVKVLRERGDAVQDRHRYRVATTSYVAKNLAETYIGKISSEKTGAMLRDASIAHLRAEGFASLLA
jgi:hypothetical protein